MPRTVGLSTRGRLEGWVCAVSVCAQSFLVRQGLDQTGHVLYRMARFHLRGSGHPEGRVTQCFVVRPQGCMLSRGGERTGGAPLEIQRRISNLSALPNRLDRWALG